MFIKVHRHIFIVLFDCYSKIRKLKTSIDNKSLEIPFDIVTIKIMKFFFTTRVHSLNKESKQCKQFSFFSPLLEHHNTPQQRLGPIHNDDLEQSTTVTSKPSRSNNRRKVVQSRLRNRDLPTISSPPQAT